MRVLKIFFLITKKQYLKVPIIMTRAVGWQTYRDDTPPDYTIYVFLLTQCQNVYSDDNDPKNVY